jgi:Ca-activated chloride channel family protein
MRCDARVAVFEHHFAPQAKPCAVPDPGAARNPPQAAVAAPSVEQPQGRKGRCNTTTPNRGARIGSATMISRALLVRFLFALACFVLLGAAARAQGLGAPTLRWHGADGKAVDAPTHSIEVRYRVTGLIAEAAVTQVFRNDSTEFLEGQYLLPLPDGAAVHTMKLRIGQRIIEGEIREREQARAEYRAAAAAGQRTSLVEQAQTNIFRTAVANVAPGETVSVEIGYWQRVRYRDQRFELVFPMDFVPRYELGGGPADDGDPTLTGTQSYGGNAPKVALEVELEPGLPVHEVRSSSHAIDIRTQDTRYHIALTQGRAVADRDFVLTWQPKAQAAPTAALFVEHGADADYAMVMMLAPAADAAQVLPRELVLVIDTSGSMYGASLTQAKAALLSALGRLTSRDRFSVIRFSSSTEPLFEKPVAVTPQALAVAREWVELLEADGGTEMHGAMQAALRDAAPQGYLRQVVFITDGAVEGADALYTLIESQVRASRLFPVGIGDAPNAAFLREAARLGRGTDTVIRNIEEVGARMDELFAKLDRPALRDVSVHWPELAQSAPGVLPDLYAGEPLVAVAKLGKARGQVDVSGLLSDAGWAKSLELARTRSDAGVGRLWARARIDDLEAEMRRATDAAPIRASIIELALAHHLVTRYTSLVAVDKTPVRPTDAALRPAVTDGDDEALALAQGATSAPLALLLGCLGLLIAVFGARRTAGSVS